MERQVQDIINSLDNRQETKSSINRFLPLLTAGNFYMKLKSLMGYSSSSKYQHINSNSTFIGKSGNWKLFLTKKKQ